MALYRIDKKYCVGDKVQLMLSNARHQIIFNKNGILYFRRVSKTGEIIIHNYLEDNDRLQFPYNDLPSSGVHNNHLFECDTIYVKITSNPNMGGIALNPDSFDFSFLLFKKLGNGDVQVEEEDLGRFACKRNKYTTDTVGVVEYIRRSSDETAKYIFDIFQGIKYASLYEREQSNELINEFNIALDEASIVEKYNRKIEPININFVGMMHEVDDSKIQESKREPDTSWKKTSINEVDEFSLTKKGFLETYSPYRVLVRDGEITVSVFDIRFIKPNEFTIDEKIYTISKERFKISNILYSNQGEYTNEPSHLDFITKKPVNQMQISLPLSEINNKKLSVALDLPNDNMQFIDGKTGFEAKVKSLFKGR